MERLESKAQLELQELRELQEMLEELEPLVFPAQLERKALLEKELPEQLEFPVQQEFRVLLEKELLVLQVLEQLVFRALREILEPQVRQDCRALQEHKEPQEMSAHKVLLVCRVLRDCKGLQVTWAERELLVSPELLAPLA
jgi:hypothetical protein